MTATTIDQIFTIFLLVAQGLHLYVLSEVIRVITIYHSDLKSHLNRIERRLLNSPPSTPLNPTLESNSDTSGDESSTETTGFEEINHPQNTNTGVDAPSCRKRRRSSNPC